MVVRMKPCREQNPYVMYVTQLDVLDEDQRHFHTDKDRKEARRRRTPSAVEV